MSRGRRSKVLPADVIQRLEQFRVTRRYSYPQLNRDVMGSPFKWSTLKNALDGKAIWEVNHLWIVQWVEKNLHRVPPATRDYKAAAANDDTPAEEPVAPARLRSE
jgi:hypothetical protein